MDIENIVVVVAGLLFGGMLVSMYMAGRNSGNLARMELTACLQVAKTEVGWQYERFRLQTLRMDWLALSSQSRQEYVRRWGHPSWSHASSSNPPPADVAVVRGRTR